MNKWRAALGMLVHFSVPGMNGHTSCIMVSMFGQRGTNGAGAPVVLVCQIRKLRTAGCSSIVNVVTIQVWSSDTSG
jgi:hypothetical protein